ncbi:hypothetical protein FPSE5266_10502 [Fusarium pseudograminearum]|nr:hypothetical protein FPSE5266_10502 [Fusarium pseudograminearum]
MEGVQRSAYFVKKPTTFKQSIRYYVVVSMGKGFFDHFEKAWARLSKGFSFDLVLHGAKGDETWAARILEYPEGSQRRSCSWLRANACCGRQPVCPHYDQHKY